MSSILFKFLMFGLSEQSENSFVLLGAHQSEIPLNLKPNTRFLPFPLKSRNHTDIPLNRQVIQLVLMRIH